MRRALVLVLGLLWLGALSAPAAADRGPWGWPVAGAREVARPFAPPASAYGAGHRGADLPAIPGAAVRASASGRVTYAGLLAGRGVVVVTHGALRTTYEPVTAVVDVGQAVSLGELVGRLEPGHLGCPVQACLHWGLRRGEDYLDPVRLVERGPVRLLPTDGSAAATAGGGSGMRTAAATASSGAAGGALTARDGSVSKRRFGTGAGPLSARGSGASDGPAAHRGSPGAAPLPAAADEPAWSVRPSEAPLGVAAVAALVVGIGLLARPAPTRPGPPGPPAAPSGAVLAGTASPAGRATTLPPPAPTSAAPSVPAPSAPVPVRPSAAPLVPAAGADDAPPVSAGADVLELAVERARRRPA